MKLFLTEYPVRNSSFGSHIWANDNNHAEKLIQRRGLGETIISLGVEKDPKKDIDTQEIVDSEKKDFHHALCFVGYVALKAGMSADTIFGDEGIIHQIFHLQPTKLTYTRRKTAFKKYLNLCQELGFMPLNEKNTKTKSKTKPQT